MLGSGGGYLCHVSFSRLSLPAFPLFFMSFMKIHGNDLTFWRSPMNPRNGSKEAAGTRVPECDREGECSVLVL